MLIKIAQNHIFQAFIFIIVIANCIVLMLDKYNISDRETNIFSLLNLIFFAMYCLEMLIKLPALGPKNYFMDPYNSFDCFLVDIALNSTESISYTNTSGLQTLRAFRLIRMFKLVKEFTELQKLLVLMREAVIDLWPLSVYFIIFLFTYTILGREWFSY